MVAIEIKDVNVCKQNVLNILFYRELSKPLLPMGKAAVLLVELLNLLCKGLVSFKLLNINIILKFVFLY